VTESDKLYRFHGTDKMNAEDLQVFLPISMAYILKSEPKENPSKHTIA